jgi:glutamine amidotransferase
MTLAVVNLGVGNTASVMFALERIGVQAMLTAEPEIIAEAERIILPGVGAAAFAMGRMKVLARYETLKAFPRPMLGVCLGQQLLFSRSEEGGARMLGRIDGQVTKIEARPDRPVPHMGWNQLKVLKDDPLLEGVPDGAWVYFVHSYASPVGDYTLASSTYGEPFSAVVRSANAWGCQFHPERSAEPGAQILRNFMSLPC